MPMDFQAEVGSTARFALVFGAMELAPTEQAPPQPRFLRKLVIDFFQKQM
jgi:hypothetical protein